MIRPILATGMHRSGGSWVAKMLVDGSNAVHINEPLNRRHPPGLSPGILRVPAPLSYQYIAEHNDREYGPGYADMLGLRYHVASELRANQAPYDLAKMVKYLTSFTAGRVRGSVPVVDDPYAVFASRWLADRHGCQVVYLVRHPAGILSSLKRIGTRWRDNVPDIARAARAARRVPRRVRRRHRPHQRRAVRRDGPRLPALPADPLGHRPGRREAPRCDRRCATRISRGIRCRHSATCTSAWGCRSARGQCGDRGCDEPPGLAPREPLGPRRAVEDRIPADG